MFLADGITTTTTAPAVLFGFTLYQALMLLFNFIAALATLIIAIVLTSKFFAVKYASLDDKNAIEFTTDMRNYFRRAVLEKLANDPPWEDEKFLWDSAEKAKEYLIKEEKKGYVLGKDNL